MFPITENGSQENNNDIIKYGPFFEVIQFLNLYNDKTYIKICLATVI